MDPEALYDGQSVRKWVVPSSIIQILGNITQFESQIWVRRMLDHANTQIYTLMIARQTWVFWKYLKVTRNIKITLLLKLNQTKIKNIEK